VEIKKKTPFDFISSILKKNVYLGEDLTGFSPYLTNKVFSNDYDSILMSNVLNNLYQMEPKAVYDFWYYAIPKTNKFIKFPKSLKEMKEVQQVREYYQVNEIIAKEYIELMDDEEKKYIKKYFEERGIKNKK